MSFAEILIGLVLLIIINIFTPKKDNNKTNIHQKDTSRLEINTKNNNIPNYGRELTQNIIQEPSIISLGGKIIVFILILLIIGAFYTFFTGKIPLDLLKYLF